MTAIDPAQRPVADGSIRPLLPFEWIALALTLPMLVSGLVFKTYDIAMDTLPFEMLRQLNAPFVFTELLVIGWAAGRGFRISHAWLQLDAPARMALALFMGTFWIGGALVSQAAPFATLFNLTYLVHLVFLGAVAHVASSIRPTDVPVFSRIVMAVLVGFCAMIAIRFAMPPPGRPVESIAWQFAIPGFISVRLFGAMLAPWAAFVLYLALAKGGERAYSTWVFAACALTAGMVVWSGTRAAVLGILVVGFVACVRYRPPLQARNVALTATAIAVGATIAVLLLPYGDRDFWLYVPSDLNGADAVASGRLALWSASWSAYLNVPFFGAGPGASAWILPASMASHIQPHNLVIEFLLNWGAIAAVAAIYLLARAIITAHRRAQRAPLAIPFVLAADCLFVMSFLDGTFHFAQHLMLWAAMIGIALAATEGGTGAAS